MEKLESTLAQIDENVKKITFFLLLRLQSAGSLAISLFFKFLQMVNRVQQHINQVHDKEKKPHECQVCNKVMKDKRNKIMSS